MRRAPKLHRKESGYYYAVFYDPEREVQRKWVGLGTDEKRYAEHRFTELSAAWMTNRYDPWVGINVEKRSVKLCVHEFLGHKRSLLKPRSVKSLEEVLLPFTEAFQGKYLSDIGPKDVLAFCSRSGAFLGHRLSAQTIKRRLVTVKSLFRWEAEMGVKIDEKVLSIKSPRVPKRPIRFLSKEEIVTLKGVFRRRLEGNNWLQWEWVALGWMIGVHCGLRPIDIANLEWRDIDFENEFITVRQSKYDGWTVPILKDDLLLMLKVKRRSDTTKVIRTSAGNPIRPDHLSARFQEVVRESGIAPVTFYEATRHTFASHMVQAGVDIYQVSKWLGHKDVKTTMIYAHLAEGSVPEAAYRAFE